MKKASDYIRYYQNPNGPKIGVASQNIIEKDGLYFRDINGDGSLNTYKDWRNTPAERAQALANDLPVQEKIGLLFINQLAMGIDQKDSALVDETGLLDEKVTEKGETIFAAEKTDGTTQTLLERKIRHIILRANPKPADLADWVNELNALAEKDAHFIPVLLASNSRNENGEIVYGMNDAAGVFATYPGTMGIAAALKGTDDWSVIDQFAQCIREEWDAVGLKKGYMYMADVVSDPRWQRTYGTFGEDPNLITKIFARMVPQIQGSETGITADGIALTVKHFPGGGTRENGFDPHYKQGQWNVYQTENSLQTYHLPAFKAAIEKHAASIMPYYAKPAGSKSLPQYDEQGQPLEMKPLGFAFNDVFINKLLRKQLGFKGYINSDSGISQNMCWGVEELDVPERIALAINTGVNIISGSMDVYAAMEAYERSKNNYYETHEVKSGYTKELLTLSDEVLTKAVQPTLEEQFQLGLFENPYRDREQAEKVIQTPAHWDEAYQVHQKSVVLLKNKANLLPLTDDKLTGMKIYAEVFAKEEETAQRYTQELLDILNKDSAITLTADVGEADFALLFTYPSSGSYFNATKGYLELDICESKTVPDVDDEGRPLVQTHEETTLYGLSRLNELADTVHANGGQVITNINVTLCWMVGNIERKSDAILAGFDTFKEATMDVIRGRFSPVGKLPVTLPKDDHVLKVSQEGVCISPNDVPGYDKDNYMPDEMKDENGKAYAYRDSASNYYELNFGLHYE